MSDEKKETVTVTATTTLNPDRVEVLLNAIKLRSDLVGASCQQAIVGFNDFVSTLPEDEARFVTSKFAVSLSNQQSLNGLFNYIQTTMAEQKKQNQKAEPKAEPAPPFKDEE